MASKLAGAEGSRTGCMLHDTAHSRACTSMDHILGRKRGQRSEANHASGENFLMSADLS